MSKINLLPKEEFDRKSYGKFLKWVLTYGRYIIISVELVVFLVFFSRFVFDQQLAELTEKIEQKESILTAAKGFEQQILSIQDRLTTVKSFETLRGQYIDLLSVLETITPKDIRFTRIVFENNEITLSGSARSNEAFARFITSLSEYPGYTDVSITTLEKSNKTEELVFTIMYKVLILPKEENAGQTKS